MGILRRFSFVVAALLAVAFVAPSASATTTTERTAETYLLGLVNADRKAAGRGTLKEHSYIRTQTESHSADMRNRKTMDHRGFSTRVSNIRAHDAGMKYSGMCENVAAASKYADVKSAMRAIDAAWKKSTDHNKCMYDKFGWTSQSASVGVRYDGKTYWVTFITAHDNTP
jgi:uncharacterized protein YkwD